MPVCDSQKPVSAEKIYAEARRMFRRIIGKNLGSLGGRERDWEGLVAREGQNILAAIEVWCKDHKDFLKECRWPLAHFLKNASMFIDDAKVDKEEKSSALPVLKQSVPEEEDFEAAIQREQIEVRVVRTGRIARCHPDQAKIWFENGYARPLEAKASA